MEGQVGVFEAFLPLMFLTIPMAFAAGWLAPKVGMNRWLWVVLFVVPVVNVVAWFLFYVVIAGALFDKLNRIVHHLEIDAPDTKQETRPVDG